MQNVKFDGNLTTLKEAMFVFKISLETFTYICTVLKANYWKGKNFGDLPDLKTFFI